MGATLGLQDTACPASHELLGVEGEEAGKRMESKLLFAAKLPKLSTFILVCRAEASCGVECETLHLCMIHAG